MKISPQYNNEDFKIVPYRGLFKISDTYNYETKPGYSVFSVYPILLFGFTVSTIETREADYLTYEEAVAHIEHLTQIPWE